MTTAKNDKSVPAKEGETGMVKLSRDQTARLFQGAAELMAQANWDLLPQLFAMGLIMHRVLEERAPEIRERAQGILDESRKKKD